MFNEDVKFGFEPSVMDGTEHIFGAGMPMTSLPKSYSYKRFLPSVLNQGQESICVPCSVSAYLNWRENLNDGSKKDNKVNYHEIYNIRTNAGDGMTFKEAFHYLRHHGVSSKAGNLQIKEYALVKGAEALKIALLMNGPCVGALPVYSDRPEFWNRMAGDGFYGYHAISLVGYNSEGFIIRNSWGTGFGKSGYTTIKFEDFGKLLEVWTIID
jgi:hypothetical protein